MFQTPQKFPSVNSPVAVTFDDDYATGSRSGELSVDDVRINRTYTTRIKAEAASKFCGPLNIINALGVKIGDPYQCPFFSPVTTDSGSFVQRIRAEQESEDGLQWIVTLEYGPFDVQNLLGTSALPQGLICPTDRAWEVYWGEPAKYQRYKTEDESTNGPDGGGNPFLNTAGDPLLDPPAIEETRPVLFLIRNESTYNDAYASQFKDTTNSDEFLGYPPNCVKCRDIKGERIWDPDWGWYFRVTYQFEFRDDDDGNGYTELIASMGYRQLKNGTGSPVNVTDSNGQQVTDAVGLQKDGSYQPGKTPYFIPFQIFPTISFGALNIPDDLLFVASGNT
jgi:hypothetical protein